MNRIEFSTIYQFLNALAPLHLQEPYDNSGCLISSTSPDCKGILIALDLTPALVQEAIDKNCNLILTHHPILFRPIQKIHDQTLEEKAIRACIQGDIALYSSHTNLDKIAEGVSFQMAKQLNLEKLTILKPENDRMGFGYIGFLKEKMQTMDFLKQLKTVFQVSCLRHSDLIYPDFIEKVALCGGAGFGLLPHAIEQKADIFISADLKYHDFFSAYQKIVLVDIGHYQSEKPIISFLHEKCTEKFPIFAVYKTKLNTNPINYLI